MSTITSDNDMESSIRICVHYIHPLNRILNAIAKPRDPIRKKKNKSLLV